MVQLQVGDHISVPGSPTHHGIYVGEEGGVKYVIHYLPDKSSAFHSSVVSNHAGATCPACGFYAQKNTGVVKTCLDCFLSGRSLEVVNYVNKECKPPDEVVKTANRLLMDGFDTYKLFSNNCEHFATYCKTGKPESEQVDDTIGAIVVGAFMTLWTAGLAFLAMGPKKQKF